jgi:polysaccharide deacetylase 2 family uncharacterized protein YibQ
MIREDGLMSDDLSTPLGQGKVRKPRRSVPPLTAPVLAGCLGLLLAIFVGWAIIADDPLGGEPMAVAPAEPRAEVSGKTEDPSSKLAQEAANPPGDGAAQPPQGGKTITIIDGTSGNRRDIVLPPEGETRSAAPADRLSEQSRHGPLPKIAQDGKRPAEAFARAVKELPGKANAPRVAIVIGGMGIGANVTADALRKLPGPVTFAFAPYGVNIERLAARARDQGHELLLQLPMEPFDYPDNDPGPQTLLTSLDASQNVDRLHWLMSRFQGYVGVMNYMGARFTASEQAMGPVLREVVKRGLIYMDDASWPRSLAGQIAGANGLPFAKADLIIDQVPTPSDIDRALSRLEAAARAKGVAVGVAGALPVSIERIARWAKGAESRGVLLVPISAVVAKARPS